MMPHATALPVWVLATILIAGTVRLMMARAGRGRPPSWARLLIALLAVAVLFLKFHTFNGLTAGTALLALMAGLKLLEAETQRDSYVITLIIYFVSIAALLLADSFWSLGYLIAVCWLTTAVLLRVACAPPRPQWQASVRYAGRILLQAAPLTLVFWLLFPRFAGPLWPMPDDRSMASSGLSDSMSPGDIDHLALSDDIAFRVRFATAPPEPLQQYWRGPVLHDFDGRTWRGTSHDTQAVPTPHTPGPAYRYTLSLEPHRRPWIFALDWPSQWDLAGATLNADSMLIQHEPVSHPIDVVITSIARQQTAEPLAVAARLRDTSLPNRRNPRTLQLAQSMRSAHPDDDEFVQAVMAMFTNQEFYYTLSPPALGTESMDEFLFDTRRGFCEHYASAFAVLMRAAGLPARVVTGYQGGTFNRFADYWILRQSDAHAWVEVWIEGHGWQRIDPTAAVSPDRVESGLMDAANPDEVLTSRWQRRSPWLGDARLRFDALRMLWRERILLYDQDSQQKLLRMLHVPEPDGQKLVILLAAALVLGLGWLTWQVRRELNAARPDRLGRAYSRLCGKLTAAGLPRSAHEGAEDYAARIAKRVEASHPDLAASVVQLCSRYTALRYGNMAATALGECASAGRPVESAGHAFESAVRAFGSAVRAFGSSVRAFKQQSAREVPRARRAASPFG